MGSGLSLEAIGDQTSVGPRPIGSSNGVPGQAVMIMAPPHYCC